MLLPLTPQKLRGSIDICARLSTWNTPTDTLHHFLVIDAPPGRLVNLPERDRGRTLNGIEQLDGNGDEGERFISWGATQ